VILGLPRQKQFNDTPARLYSAAGMKYAISSTGGKALLALFILFDSYAAWQLWRHGPPMLIIDEKELGPGEVSFKMTREPLSHED
jgi:hypothetical protein